MFFKPLSSLGRWLRKLTTMVMELSIFCQNPKAKFWSSKPTTVEREKHYSKYSEKREKRISPGKSHLVLLRLTMHKWLSPSSGTIEIYDADD